MTKILCIVMFAVSLMGGATVVLAKSSRDLTEPTGTEANRLKTQYGGYYGYYGGGYLPYAYSPGPNRPWHWSHRHRGVFGTAQKKIFSIIASVPLTTGSGPARPMSAK